MADQKIKKIHPEDGMTIVMDQNPDILKTLGGMKKQQFLVGFAAETQNLLENAASKVKKKNLDMIVANDVSLKGAGFNTDTNIVKFLYPDGTVTLNPFQTMRLDPAGPCHGKAETVVPEALKRA